DEYAIVDDVAVQKVADATDSVEAMIDRFDTAGADAARAKADIEKWCATIGSENISNYSTFESKLASQIPGGEVQNEEIPYWDVSNGSVVSLQEEAVSGEKALKATFSSNGSVAITTKDKPFAFGSGYYTLSFWTKGTGNIKVTAKAYSTTNEVTILEQEVNLSDTWKETVIQGIDVPEGYRLKSLSFMLSAEVAGEILLDAIQMYKQLGPGSALDDIVVENRGDVLFLDGAPEGYAVSIYSTSDKSVLGMDGTIATPEYDTCVEYSYVIVNENDANDKAVSQKYALRVAGTYGVDTGFRKQTVTDKATGISATGLMKDNATISVRSLDAGSEYYATALKDGYNSIGCYDVYLIPESAYSGAVTVNFKIDSSYNGKAVTVVHVNKDTGKVTEFTGVVANGVLSVETLEDGVFMLQLQSTQTVPDDTGGSDTNTNPSNKDSLTNGSNGGSTDTPADTNQPLDMDSQTDNNGETPADTTDDSENSNGDDTDQTSRKSRQNNKKIRILIVVIGMALILIALAITATILILGKNDDKSEQNVIEES
ncbi:MAG: hypothetical protein IJE60_07730, partial [Tyzzerella sp.]|nr:hypothetical protein [Tyzzerella sp.]